MRSTKELGEGWVRSFRRVPEEGGMTGWLAEPLANRFRQR
jgi:hypothetical protein